MIKKFPCTLLVSVVALSLAGAQTSDPSAPPAGGEAKRPPAALRAWIFPEKEAGLIDFNLSRGTGEAPVSLASSERGSKVVGGGYEKLPEGRVILQLARGPEAFASSEAELQPGGYYTAVAWQAAGKWQIKLFRDPAAKAGAAARPLRVLNFAADRETVLAVDGAEKSKFAAGSVQEISLPAKINGLSVKVLDPTGGVPAETSFEVDLSALPLAYAVVGPDYRGRMRPEIIEGGPPKPETLVALTVPEIDPAEQAKLERERRAANRRLERDHLAAQMAILEAQIKEGVNVPDNADGLKQDLQKRIKELQSEPPAAAPVPAPTN
jgi:hypothetical protein